MQLEPERAPEIFFAWKAVCYYQVRFSGLLEALKTMFQWTGHNQLCFPVDHVSLSKEEVRHIEEKRTLLRVDIPSAADPEQKDDARHTAKFVEALMGRKAEKRFSYIQENAKFVTDIDV